LFSAWLMTRRPKWNVARKALALHLHSSRGGVRGPVATAGAWGRTNATLARQQAGTGPCRIQILGPLCSGIIFPAKKHGRTGIVSGQPEAARRVSRVAFGQPGPAARAPEEGWETPPTLHRAAGLGNKLLAGIRRLVSAL